MADAAAPVPRTTTAARALTRILALFAARGLPAALVVILSGEADPAAQGLFLDAGAAQVVVKPSRPEALRGLRQLALARRAAAAGAGGGPRRRSRGASMDVARGNEGWGGASQAARQAAAAAGAEREPLLSVQCGR